MSSKVSRRGRPPSRSVERAVFDEALRLVAVPGSPEPTRRAVAEGAGVSRTTLYNRWPTVADIVLDALLDRAARSVGPVDVGSDRAPATIAGGPVDGQHDGGLRGYLTRLADATSGWARPGLQMVVAAAQHDATFAARFRSDFLERRHAALVGAVVEHGSDRADEVAELIAGSLWFRVLVADLPLDDAWVQRMFDLAGGSTTQVV